jgi:hypothetical protein
MCPIKAVVIATLVLTKAQCLRSFSWAAQLNDDGMAAEREKGEENTKKPSPPGEDLVITPAGPVRKENVHQVGPNQAVRRNTDGTYTIVPESYSQ